jgi:hypothetical protein
MLITSNEVNATPAAAATVTLNAVAGNNRVDLSWNAIANATAQRVYRRFGGNPYMLAGTVPVGTVTFADIKGSNGTINAVDPTNGTTYTYKVEVDVP